MKFSRQELTGRRVSEGVHRDIRCGALHLFAAMGNLSRLDDASRPVYWRTGLLSGQVVENV
jgi:hypothetical protein